VDAMEEVVRLLAIQLRRQTESQAEAIKDMHRVGFGPTRIAELLGTTPNTVNVSIAKKKRPKES
jgi:hypothetical protein